MNKPLIEFESSDGIWHIIWAITDIQITEKIEKEFSCMQNLYIADGHHRSASSVKVGLKRREKFPDYSANEEFNYFLAVAFPDEDLLIMDYNRIVKDLNGYTAASFIEKLAEKFIVTEMSGIFRPHEKHTFGMYLENRWYRLAIKKGIFDNKDILERLDVSILQDNVLRPLLGIDDPRTDKRIDFVGGIRGLAELEKRVSRDMAVAFSMYPTTIENLICVADAGLIMPPKSTWFEPKLRSGLLVHRF